MLKEGKLHRVFNKKTADAAITALALLIGAYFGWKIIEILIFGFFIWAILKSISSRLAAMPALFFLALTPLFLILKKNEIAEEASIYAYYFLILTVILGIYEIRKLRIDSNSERKSQDSINNINDKFRE
jgi:hypothetical protein